MNPAQNQALQQARLQGQQNGARLQMYTPEQIRSLPNLSEDAKTKYENGLRGLYNKLENSPENSTEHLQAKQKIMEFTRMLSDKINQRRVQIQQQQQQQQAQQQQQQPQQQAAAQPAQTAQAVQQPQPTPAQAQPRPAPAQQNAQAQNQAQRQQAAAAAAASAAAANVRAAPTATPAQAAQGQEGKAATPARPKIPDNILQHVNQMQIRPPAQVADPAKWLEEMKDRYARALLSMESNKTRITSMDKWVADKTQSGTPLTEEEKKGYQAKREQQMKFYGEALKWVEGFRRQYGIQDPSKAAAQNGAAATQATKQPGPAAASAAQNNNQVNNVNQTTPAINAAVEAAKNQQVPGGNRASPANGATTPLQQQQARAAQNAQQAASQPQAQQPHPAQQQPKQEQPHPPAVNTALAAAVAQAQASGNATPVGARVQTPQSSTPVTAAGPTRALSHSAALSLANQRASNTPGSAPVPGQQATPGSGGGAVNASIMGSGAQQGHSHAHPTQQQSTISSKMPIPKVLPEKATNLPQGVSVGSGVNTGRPTMSQGSGTLGGVMNQPAIPKIPAYNHEAEGDHVLSKKKLDELVRQVCGGSAEGQDGNILTAEVEEVSVV